MDDLDRIHGLLESTDKTAVFTDLPNEQVAAECGDLLLCHLNKINMTGAFALIVITGFETAYSLEGDTTISSLWRDLDHRISPLIPKNASIFNTYSGFVIHVWGEDSEKQIEESLNKVAEEFKTPFKIQGRQGISHTHLGCHIGYLIYPVDSGNLYDYTDIIRHISSSAWYKTEEESSRPIHINRYTTEISTALLRRETISNRIITAIEQDTLHFEFQPEVEIENNQISGVEILVRWDDELLGTVSPEEFIPIIEKLETIIPFTKYTIDKAIEFISVLDGDVPKDCIFFINISKSIFYWDNFDVCDYIIESLQNHDCPAKKFGVEITESAYFEPSITGKVRQILSRLNDHGVTIVIDDFGTGYGSLSLLSSNTITGIKLDKSLTTNLVSRAVRTDFLDMLCHLAERYTIRLVAEGVEHDWQIEMLKLKKVSIAQGYIISPPVVDSELIETIKKF